MQGRNKKAGLTIRGYVDDGLLIAKAADKIKSVILIQEAFEKKERWAHLNGMIFDLAKFEAIHFSQKKISQILIFFTGSPLVQYLGGAANGKTSSKDSCNALAKGYF